jgi:mRNA-degrading endonuclease RelE of RelBE toxin-antitoxin system
VILYKVVLTPEAEEDIANGYAWYLEYSHASASAWRLRVLDSISYVSRSSLSPKIWRDDLRLWKVKQSKYSIIYRVQDQTVTIAAIAHSRMNDQRWRDR